MSYGSESQVAEGLLNKAKASSRVLCPKCRDNHPRRIEREGFMQKHIYPWLGYYPWNCRHCNNYFLLRKRNRSKCT